MVNKLRNCRADILLMAIFQTERLQMKAGGAAARIKAIDKEIAELSGKNLVLARLNTKGILRPAEYAEQSGGINSKMNILRSERRMLLQEQDESGILPALRWLNDSLMSIKQPLTEMDEELFDSIVEQMTIPTDTTVCFRLLGGLTLIEAIPDRRRCKRT